MIVTSQDELDFPFHPEAWARYVNSKKKCQTVHFKRRAKERFGMELNRRRRIEVLQQIRSGKSRFVSRSSCRVSVHEVEVEGQVVRVVYDKLRGSLVTVLPKRKGGDCGVKAPIVLDSGLPPG